MGLNTCSSFYTQEEILFYIKISIVALRALYSLVDIPLLFISLIPTLLPKEAATQINSFLFETSKLKRIKTDVNYDIRERRFFKLLFELEAFVGGEGLSFSLGGHKKNITVFYAMVTHDMFSRRELNVEIYSLWVLIFKSRCRENRSYSKTITPKIKKKLKNCSRTIFFSSI